MDKNQLEEVKLEAKQVLDNFSRALDKAKVKKKDLKVRIGGFREEGSGNDGDKEFRKRIFDNAPEVEGDFIIAEKKKW